MKEWESIEIRFKDGLRLFIRREEFDRALKAQEILSELETARKLFKALEG